MQNNFDSLLSGKRKKQTVEEIDDAVSESEQDSETDEKDQAIDDLVFNNSEGGEQYIPQQDEPVRIKRAKISCAEGNTLSVR